MAGLQHMVVEFNVIKTQCENKALISSSEGKQLPCLATTLASQFQALKVANLSLKLGNTKKGSGPSPISEGQV